MASKSFFQAFSKENVRTRLKMEFLEFASLAKTRVSERIIDGAIVYGGFRIFKKNAKTSPPEDINISIAARKLIIEQLEAELVALKAKL